MLLPHWTDGCIASMEGLFFEASGTTPYHFLTTAAMSKQSSNPVRELRYVDNDASVGVPHLPGARRALRDGAHRRGQGARRPSSDELDAARRERSVGDLPGRRLRRRRAARRAAGRRRRPRRATSASATSSSARAGSSTATSGRRSPPTTARTTWQRIDASRPRPGRPAGEPETRGSRSTSSCRRRRSTPVALPAVEVSDVEMGQQELSFRVDQVGVPVLVKVSYFPNWAVDGAEGPYRVAPEHDGRRADRERGHACTSSAAARTCSSTS